MVQPTTFAHHYESSGRVPATVEEVFAFMDDPTRLTGHMTKSSWMMGGGRVAIQLDCGLGQRVGSRILIGGRAFGLELELEEVIGERIVPQRKTWHTVGTPRLVVIGRYRMGFELARETGHTRLRVFIDYDLPQRRRWLGRLLGAWYARWCTERMLGDTRAHFSRAG